jgi:sirohydrochlorin ferrochelatase
MPCFTRAKSIEVAELGPLGHDDHIGRATLHRALSANEGALAQASISDNRCVLPEDTHCVRLAPLESGLDGVSAPPTTLAREAKHSRISFERFSTRVALKARSGTPVERVPLGKKVPEGRLRGTLLFTQTWSRNAVVASEDAFV